MKLAKQSQLFIGVIVLILLGSIIIDFQYTTKLNFQRETFSKVEQLVQGMFELNILTNEYIMSGTRRPYQQWIRRHASLVNILLTISNRVDAENISTTNKLRVKLSELRNLFTKILINKTSDGFPISKTNKPIIYKLSSQARLLSQQIVSNVNSLGKYTQAQLDLTEKNSKQILQLSSFIIGCLFIAVMIWVNQVFLKPIRQLHKHAKTLISGSYYSKTDLKTNNELGELAESYNILSDTIWGKMKELTRNTRFLEKSLNATKIAESRYSTIFNSASDGIVIINHKGIIQSVNPSAEALFDYTSDELIGENVAILVPSPHKYQHDNYLENYKKTRKAKIIGARRELEGLRKDGEHTPISLAISEMTLEGKTYFSGVIRDISEEIKAKNDLIRTNEQLSMTNKELEAYAYSISHDLRSPLRVIDGYSMILLEDYADELSSEVRDYLLRIRKGTDKMGDLITNLLKMSQTANETLMIESFDLSKIIKEVIEQLQQIHKNRKIELNYLPEIQITGDKTLIQDVMENLINNSVKFSAKQAITKIEIGSSTNADNLQVIFVKDNGVGFNMAHQSKLFQPFQRLHKVNQFEGSGIGLATVHRIIKLHKGDIWAESEPDKGATFYFTLNPTLN